MFKEGRAFTLRKEKHKIFFIDNLYDLLSFQ